MRDRIFFYLICVIRNAMQQSIHRDTWINIESKQRVAFNPAITFAERNAKMYQVALYC